MKDIICNFYETKIYNDMVPRHKTQSYILAFKYIRTQLNNNFKKRD